MQTIDKTFLEGKLKGVNDSFKKIDEEIQGIDAQVQILNQQRSNRQVEQLRLQGQFNLLTELLSEKKEEAPK